jgi:hypothetical protein
MHLQKNFRRILIAFIAAALLVAIAAYFLAKYVEDKARNILATTPLIASTISANLFTRTLELGSVDWTQANDSLPKFPHHLFVNSIRLEGISVYRLLVKKKLHIDKIIFDVGEFQFNRGLKKPRSEVKELNIDLENVAIDRIEIKDVYTKVFTDSLIQYEGLVSLNLDNLVIGDLDSIGKLTAYEVESFDAVIKRLNIKGRKDMYTSTISKIHANSAEGKIEIDSVLLVPKYSKYRFSRKVGRELDRMNVLLPKISINDFAFGEVKDSVFRAASIEVKSPELYIYKDKRLPFKKEKDTPLPIAMLRGFKVGIAVDSVKIIDANITYEEFPENGYHTGKVTFERLNATLDHLTNRDHYPDYKQATLKATSFVMGKGLLKAEFSLPYGKSQVYNAKGSIGNFSLHRLNPILENLAFVSVTSGRLNQLTFNFDYTDRRSSGSVVVNYEDLKINSLTKEKSPEKNELKTFIVNTLLRKNKDEKVDMEKRTGTIEFERERKRAIFHYWWRSLLSGIKSSAGELPQTKGNKNEE